jgi:ubiquinone/menaquinone biosynthesis C-methylase UbiE
MQPAYRLTAEKTWDAIADSFNTTRQNPWKYCLNFIDSLKETDVVADLGCGNGRHVFPCAEQCSSVFGVDISVEMLNIVKMKLHMKSMRNVSLVHADVVQLPIADNMLDAVLFIASLHNIQGKEHRHAALQEVMRVLKPQGSALISVWSRWQDKYYKYFLKQFIVRSRDFGNINVYWRQHNLSVPRFYHLYGKAEFLQELRDAGFRIEDLSSVKIHSKRFPDNYFAIVRKR